MKMSNKNTLTDLQQIKLYLKEEKTDFSSNKYTENEDWAEPFE